MSRFPACLTVLCLATGSAALSQDASPFPVHIEVDAARPMGPLKPIWRFFGADEPNYAYMTNGEKLIGELGEMKPKEVFFRTHSLLVTGEGTHGLKWGSTNAYTEDAQGNPFHAKGQPKDVDGRVQMGISNQLRDIDNAFTVIARYPEFANTPIVIGESDPEGCAACQGPNLAYRNGTMYSCYTAASFPRKLDLAAKHGVNLEGAVTWAFEFEDQPYFAGFRTLATNGVDKPVLNVFRMFSKMDGQRLPVTSDSAVSLPDILRGGVRGKADVSAFASLSSKKLCVLVWHYHDDDLQGPDAAVSLTIPGLPVATAKAKLTHYRVDETHGNSFTLWKALGQPQTPTPEQFADLEAAGKLATLGPDTERQIADHTAAVDFNLPLQGVSLLVLEWE